MIELIFLRTYRLPPRFDNQFIEKVATVLADKIRLSQAKEICVQLTSCFKTSFFKNDDRRLPHHCFLSIVFTQGVARSSTIKKLSINDSLLEPMEPVSHANGVVPQVNEHGDTHAMSNGSKVVCNAIVPSMATDLLRTGCRRPSISFRDALMSSLLLIYLVYLISNLSRC